METNYNLSSKEEIRIIDKIISTCKDYINNKLNEYSLDAKKLSHFESQYMKEYAGRMGLEHTTFRIFLRNFVEQREMLPLTRAEIQSVFNW